MWMAWVFAALVALGAVVGLVGGCIRRKENRVRNESPYVTEPAPVLERDAVVTGKDIGKQMTGSYQTPGHRVVYVVEFQLDDGRRQFEVTDAEYDRLVVGERGKLIYQADCFVDFDKGAA